MQIRPAKIIRSLGVLTALTYIGFYVFGGPPLDRPIAGTVAFLLAPLVLPWRALTSRRVQVALYGWLWLCTLLIALVAGFTAILLCRLDAVANQGEVLAELIGAYSFVVLVYAAHLGIAWRLLYPKKARITP